MIAYSPSAGGFVRAEHYVPAFTVIPSPLVVDEGSTTPRVQDDANVTDIEEAEIIFNATIQYQVDDDPVFESLTPGIGAVDSMGNVERVSNGNAIILATVGPNVQKLSVPVSETTGGDATLFASWVPGTAAAFATDAVAAAVSGVTASPITRSLFAGGVRNPDLFCGQYAPGLTGVAAFVSGSSSMGFTAITPWHVVGCEHIGDYSGRTITWITEAGASVTRTLVKWYQVPSRDIAVYMLDRALPETIFPVKLLPANVLDYLANPQFPMSLLFVDRSNYVNTAASFGLEVSSGAITTPAGDLTPFYTYPEAGTSGKPILLPFGEGATDIALWATFQLTDRGPSYHSLDWPTILAALELSANRFSGAPEFKDFAYFKARVDPSYRSDTPGFYDEFTQLKQVADEFPWDLSGTTTRAIIYLSDKPSTGSRTALEAALVAKGIRFCTSATSPANADFTALATATGGVVRNNYAALYTQAQALAAWSNIFPANTKLQVCVVFNQAASNNDVEPVNFSGLTSAFKAALPGINTNYLTSHTTVEWGYAITDFSGLSYMTTGEAVQPVRADLSAFPTF